MDIFRKRKLHIIKQVSNLYWTLLMIIYVIILFTLFYLFLFNYISFTTLILLYSWWIMIYAVFKWNIIRLKNRYKPWFHTPNLWVYFLQFIKERIRSLFISIGFLFLFMWYHNDYSPYYVNQYEILNSVTGQKITFQEMVHIWSSDYYDKISQDIKAHSDQWYTLYFEELVQKEEDGDKDNYKDFLLATILQKLEDEKNWVLTHKNIMKQENDALVFHAKKAVRADTSKDILENHWEENPKINYFINDIESIKNEALVLLFLKNSGKQKLLQDEIINKIRSWEIWESEIETIEGILRDVYNSNKQINVNIKDLQDMNLDNISEKTDILYDVLSSNDTTWYLAKWFTNFVFKLNWMWNKNNWLNTTNIVCKIIQSEFCDTFQWRVLDYRDKVLAEYVLTKEDEKIFITYWQAHFEGFFEYLNQKSLDKWEGKFIIVSQKKIKVL